MDQGWNAGAMTAPGRETVQGTAAEMPPASRRSLLAQAARPSLPRLSDRRKCRKHGGSALRERPRRAVRGGWRAIDWIPRSKSFVLAAAEMPSAVRKGGKTI